MRGTTTWDKIIYWIFADKIPLTKMLIISSVATFFAIVLFRLNIITHFLGYDTRLMLLMPWTLLTYPIIGACCSSITLLFSCYWMWVAGGSIERARSTQGFAVYFFTMSAISALGLYLAAVITGIPVGLSGLLLPLAGVTVAFSMMNPEQQILFFFILPLKLKYLALLDVALVLVQYGSISIIHGILALAGCAYSYWYVVQPNIIPTPSNRGRGQIVRVYKKRNILISLNPFRWIKEYQERKKLRKLFERTDWEDKDR